MIGNDREEDPQAPLANTSFAGAESAVRTKFGRTVLSGDDMLLLAAADIARSCTFEEKAYGGSAAAIKPSDC